MTYEKFTTKNSSGKSLLDQQNENLEILKLLKLEESFSNAIVFRNGCSPEVKKLLENLNIDVLKN